MRPSSRTARSAPGPMPSGPRPPGSLPASSATSSTRASRCGSVWSRSSSRMRRCPCTMARMVPSCRRMTWAILARVPIGYSSSTALTSSVSEERWVMSATGWDAAHRAVERLYAAIAADLQRDDHLREDDRVAQGDQRQHLDLLQVALLLLLLVCLGCSSELLVSRVSSFMIVLSCPFGRGWPPLPSSAHPARPPRRNARHQLHRTVRRRGSCPSPRAEG